ncbi:MAG: hypothetical protein HN426_01005 [Nitrospina sp.]|nr:hypothetical protein [Nitrospina sp.]
MGFVDGDSLADMWIEVVWLSGVMVGRKLKMVQRRINERGKKSGQQEKYGV